MIRAFTGPSGLTYQQLRWIATRMLEEPPAEVWRSGCAFGVDTIAAYLAIAIGVDLELFVPAAPHNSSIVNSIGYQADLVVRTRSMGERAESYRLRNQQMLKGSDQLLAFVKRFEFYRSGEWMTINIAKQSGVPVQIVTIPTGRQ